MTDKEKLSDNTLALTESIIQLYLDEWKRTPAYPKTDISAVVDKSSGGKSLKEILGDQLICSLEGTTLTITKKV